MEKLNISCLLFETKEQINHNLSKNIDRRTFSANQKYNVSTETIVGPTFSAIALMVGIFGNILALFVIYQTAKLHKWKVFYKMITLLAIVDFIGIITTSPIVLAVYANKLQWFGGNYLCNYVSVMLIFCGLTSCLIISAMAIDRYVAIVYPFFYISFPKQKVAKFVITGILLFSLIVSLLPVFGLGHNVIHFPGTWCFPDFRDKSTEHAFFCYFYSCIILLLVLTTAVLNVIGIIKLQMGRNSEVRRDSNTSNSKSRRHADVYIMILLIAIFTVFTVCWAPFMVRIIMNQIEAVAPDEMTDLLTLRMASFNQILNPWVYLLFRRESLKRFARRFN